MLLVKVGGSLVLVRPAPGQNAGAARDLALEVRIDYLAHLELLCVSSDFL